LVPAEREKNGEAVASVVGEAAVPAKAKRRAPMAKAAGKKKKAAK
jgi:hypothetical protein